MLKSRGLVHQITDEKSLSAAFDQGPVTFYIGFDPTADSLHVGSLKGIMVAAHLQRMGHVPVMLVGGGTGLIGDPSGKSKDRNILSSEILKHNESCIGLQLQKFVNTNNPEGFFLNNADWLKSLNYLEFLRDVGVYFRVNEMVKNDTYRLKLDSGEGLSFVEFNYQLLQAYDFKYLFEKYNCSLQIGGSDQWGNITAGTDLVRRSNGANVFGLTIPLAQTSDGKKMGKTESGAVWLDANKTTPYDFYQFWINCTDEDVFNFLKVYTFMSVSDIDSLPRVSHVDLKKAKETLAYIVTEIVHGDKLADEAKAKSNSLFSEDGDKHDLAIQVGVSRSDAESKTIVSVLSEADSSVSKSELRRLITSNAVKADGLVLKSDVSLDELFPSGQDKILITVGKKKFFSVKLI